MHMLFVCEYNACRSQMAEGIARRLLPETVSVQSAGLYPGEVHVWTIEVMHEIGIDLSSHRSKKLEAVAAESFDVVAILAEPAVKATRVIHAKERLLWFYPDPAKESGGERDVKQRLRRVRDALQVQITTWMKR